MGPAATKVQASATLRYVLAPDSSAATALRNTLAEYGLMLEIISELAASAGSNLVTLHALAYETVRKRTRLPSRLVTLGLRDFAARRAGDEVAGIPLDDKLYTLKSASELSISTVAGRVIVPFDVAGYTDGWKGSLPARLVFDHGVFELRIGVNPHISTEEKTMIHEGILSRMGRLIAGVTYATIEKAEGANGVAIVEQAIREIDSAAEEARAELGKSRAEEHRIASRRTEISEEIAALEEKVRFALKEGREDLAKAAVARQIDLESQVAAIEKALADVAERIEEGQQAMQAVLAARREAEARLADLRRSVQKHDADGGTTGRRSSPDLTVAKASAAVTRVTGVPGGSASGSAELEELDRMHRERAIAERLARFKTTG
ncbi:MAG: PspA/IM30 family protein [Pseudorhodoplanes sp.]|uniref:PspA/IM30 family protein n=1 Tax=Pseudorhodoplanes sp. TaxID=1934341 RepID=UPI003D10ED7B